MRKLFHILCLLPVWLLGATLHAQHTEFQPGDLFLGQGGGVIQWRDANGTFIRNIITGDGSDNGNGTGLRFHPLTGELWVTNSNTVPNSINGVRIIHKDGTAGHAINISAYQNTPTSITFDRQGNAYIGGLWNDGEIVKVNPQGTAILDHYPVSTDGYIWGPEWVEMDCSDSVIYYTNLRNKIKRYNVVTKQQLPDFADLTGIASWLFSMRFLPDQTLLVVAADNVVLRLNPNGQVIQTYTPTQLCGLFGMATTENGLSFWAGGLAFNAPIYKFDIATGNVQTNFLASPNLPGINVHGIAVYSEPLKNCATTPPPLSGTEMLKVYPNPGNGHFTLQTKMTDKIFLRVFNLIGQVIYSRQLNLQGENNTIPVDISSHPAGVYFLQAENSNIISRLKIVIR